MEDASPATDPPLGAEGVCGAEVPFVLNEKNFDMHRDVDPPFSSRRDANPLAGWPGLYYRLGYDGKIGY